MNMNPTKILIIMALVMTALAGLGWYVVRDNDYTITINNSDQLSKIFARNGIESTTYKNDEFGVALAYRLAPNGYVAVTPIQLSEGKLLAVSFFKENEYLELLESALAREAPPAITLEIFSADRTQTVEDWIKKNKLSNFNLSDSKLTATVVGGVGGFSYNWSGLYQGRSLALSRGEKIYVFSVQYLMPTDDIIADFDNFIGTVEFFTSKP